VHCHYLSQSKVHDELTGNGQDCALAILRCITTDVDKAVCTGGHTR
jgi:hypothetical protein